MTKWQFRVVAAVLVLVFMLSVAMAFGWLEITRNWPFLVPEGFRDWLDWTFPVLLG